MTIKLHHYQKLRRPGRLVRASQKLRADEGVRPYAASETNADKRSDPADFPASTARR